MHPLKLAVRRCRQHLLPSISRTTKQFTQTPCAKRPYTKCPYTKCRCTKRRWRAGLSCLRRKSCQAPWVLPLLLATDRCTAGRLGSGGGGLIYVTAFKPFLHGFLAAGLQVGWQGKLGEAGKVVRMAVPVGLDSEAFGNGCCVKAESGDVLSTKKSWIARAVLAFGVCLCHKTLSVELPKTYK